MTRVFIMVWSVCLLTALMLKSMQEGEVVKERTRQTHIVRGLLFALALWLCAPFTAFAASDPDFTGGSAVVGYSGSAAPITDLQVTGTGNPTVPVKLRVTSGSLAMTTTTGLTFTGSPTGSTLQFSGSMTSVNTALATLQYTRSGTGTDTLEASMVNPGEVFFTDNGHLYEYVSYTANWQNAKTNAESRTKYGATGYLTTITSQAENDFVAARLLNAGWMGASDVTTEGDWKWVTGPESTTSFWSGASNGSAVSGRYANWGTGEPNDSGGEDCGQFLTGGSGKWNDLPCASMTLPGYVAEYGSVSSPIDIPTKNVSITTQAANSYPNAPTSFTPTNVTDGSWINATAPTLAFSITDPDSGNTTAYRIQVDDTANFSSPVIDYTSGTKSQGSFNFVVGQAAGAGTSGVGAYTVGSSGQTLGQGSYYWRVKAIDNLGAESSYAVANAGAVAFRVDTTAPTRPGAPDTQTPTTDTTPSWTWSASTDAGAGLAAQPYSFQYSTDPTFGTYTEVANLTSANYTQGSTLADGTWYARVTARDTLGHVASSLSNGSVLIDTTAPTLPSVPLNTTAASNNTPTWTWTASTDAGAGLASFPYMIEWSRDQDFLGTTYTEVTATNAFTHTTQLADGFWYIRVKARDSQGNVTPYTAARSIKIDTAVPVVPSQPGIGSRPTSFLPAVVPAPIVNALQPATPAVVQLQNTATAQQISLQPGQSLAITVNGEEYNVVLKELGSDYAVLRIPGTTQDVRIRLSQDNTYDMNGDGQSDLQIKLQSISSGFAQMLATPLIAAESKAVLVQASMSWAMPIWFAVTVLSLIALWWIVSSRQHAGQKRSH